MSAAQTLFGRAPLLCKLQVPRAVRPVCGRRLLNGGADLRQAGSLLVAGCRHCRRQGRAPLAVHAAAAGTVAREEVITGKPQNNVTDNIFQKIGADLHRRPGHPICIIKDAIIRYFEENSSVSFKNFDHLYPVVSAKAHLACLCITAGRRGSSKLPDPLQNFDDVLVPVDHVSRSPNDSYYVDADTVLRCHTSAHQAELLRKGETHFLVTGDVYRRDSIDASHYPVFHQMEGVRVFSDEEVQASGMTGKQLADQELRETLQGLAKHLFGDVQMKFVDAYFPFTDPSYELEIFFQGQWLEVLGCGVMQQAILDEAGHTKGRQAWAFGLGLERLAMVLFDIPDIRLFWSNDTRFTKQFKDGSMHTKFKPYSRYPPCYKDVSFWLPEDDSFTENNLCEQVRSIAGDLVEEVKLIDNFTHPKKKRTSHCYRIAYRSMERSLTDDEINDLQSRTRQVLEKQMGVELR